MRQAVDPSELGLGGFPDHGVSALVLWKVVRMQICSCRRVYHFLIWILNFFFMLLLTFTLFFFFFFFPFPFFPFLSFPFFLFLFLFFLPTVFWSFTSLCGFPWTPHAIHRGYSVHNTNIGTVYYKRKDSTYSEWSSELDAKISVCPYSLPGLGAGTSTWLSESPVFMNKCHCSSYWVNL